MAALLVGVLSAGTPGGALAQPRPDTRVVEAIALYTGTAGRVDDAKARALIDAAATDGDVLARMWIARAWSRGRLGYARDEARARAIADQMIGAVQRQAALGVVEAQFLMGTAYDEGLGVTEDPAVAFGWFQKAAAGGHTLAEHNIGNAYAAGRGVSADPAAAVSWWTRAALKGDAVPQLRLGEAYERGSGVAADLVQARRWYADAAGRGNAAAKAALERLGSPR
ncbi:MAG: sel1 repeat family protein [Acidobacteria bacterium]|nr:sel1 repeat family protein [Acidobacteriota bacterium]